MYKKIKKPFSGGKNKHKHTHINDQELKGNPTRGTGEIFKTIIENVL